MRGIKVYAAAVVFAFLLISQGFAYIVKSVESSEKELDELEVYHNENQKRGVLTALVKILAGSAGLITVANVGFNLYLEKHGCCKLKHPNFCSKQDEIGSLFNEWKIKAEEVGEVALKGSLQITSIDSIHSTNQVIRTKLAKVIRNMDTLVTVLFDNDLNALKVLKDEIDKIYRDNERDMKSWTIEDFNAKFQGVWGDPKGMAILFAPLLLEAGSFGLGRMMKWNRMRKIQNEVGAELTQTILRNRGGQSVKASKLLQGSYYRYSRSKFIEKTAQARYNAAKAKPSKFKLGVAGAFSVFIIGFEIWNTMEKLEQCNQIRSRVDKNHHVLVTEIDKVDRARTLMDGAEVTINEAYTNLTESISSAGFLGGIANLEDLVKGASTQNRKTEEDAANLAEFRTKISGAVTVKNNTEIHRLQGLLSTALGDIEYHYDCLVKKAEAIRSLINDCKAGHADLMALYDEKKISFRSCVVKDDGTTPPYLSYASVETAIKSDANKSKYSENCKLNSPLLKTVVCTDYCNNMDTDTKTIEEKYQITSTDVQFLCGNYSCELSDQEKRQICFYKNVFNASVEQVSGLFSAAKKTLVIAHYEQCPAP